jgi:hypothetical protein
MSIYIMDPLKDNINNIINYVEDITDKNNILENENKIMKSKIEILENEMNNLSLFIGKKLNDIKSPQINKTCPIQMNPTQMNKIRQYFSNKHKKRKEIIKGRNMYSDSDSDDDYINMKLIDNIPSSLDLSNDLSYDVSYDVKEYDVKEDDVIKKLFKDNSTNIFIKKDITKK